MKKYIIILAVCAALLLLANVILAIIHFHMSYVFGTIAMLGVLGLLYNAYRMFDSSSHSHKRRN